MRFSPSARVCRLTFPPMLRIMKAPKGVFFMRHAWLIITHGNFEILEKQLRFLDSENADFFIHVDARVKDFDFAHVRSIPRKSRVTFLDRKPISWGHFSQVDCELRLLCAAVPGGYDYYHLLSGVDVPVKTRQYIENYFSSVQPGTNFVHFQHKEIIRDHRDRVKFYYPLQRWNLQNRIIRLALRRTGELLQRPFVDRTKKDLEGYVFQKGAQWFSITHALAAYVLSQEDWLRERYRSTFCADEIFLQTLVVNSPFRDTLPSDYFGDDHKTCLRYIDWQRGKPYSFRNEDYSELIVTPPEYLFARKFDYRTNAEVVDRLFAHFGEEASD